MNYPLISEYVEAIKAAEDNFEELSYLRPVMDDNGLPVMTSGNFAVVFKMKDERDEKYFAVKCFTKEQEGREEAYHQITEELKNVSSPYLTSVRYLDKELFVDTDQTNETEFPVLLMDWVEGLTLDKYLRANLDDKFALEMLAYRFSQLAQWLIPQPFAHGDLKPDNILVREDGTLVLVDYDGMYVPAMKGQKARELGSPDFRHPQRTENDFDEHIDDFPLVSILLSLKAISIEPQFLNKYGAADRLLFSISDYRNIAKCKVVEELYPSYDNSINYLVILFKMQSERKSYYRHLSAFDKYRQLSIEKPSLFEMKDTAITIKEWNQCLIYNDYRIGLEKYSADKSKLLLFGDTQVYGYLGDYYEESVEEYTIRRGTKIICNRAFRDNKSLNRIVIPESVELIGKKAFENCHLTYIELPSSIRYIDKNAFQNCIYLRTIIIPKGTISRFSWMLPYNIPQLVEIDILKTKDDITETVKKTIERTGCTTFIFLKSLLSKTSELCSYIGITDVQIHLYKERCCLLYFKLPVHLFLFGDGRHYEIRDIDDINSVGSIIYQIIIDLGCVELIQDVNSYFGVQYRKNNIYNFMNNLQMTNHE